MGGWRPKGYAGTGRRRRRRGGGGGGEEEDIVLVGFQKIDMNSSVSTSLHHRQYGDVPPLTSSPKYCTGATPLSIKLLEVSFIPSHHHILPKQLTCDLEGCVLTYPVSNTT